jgi:arylsulfate sulfotransferase
MSDRKFLVLLCLACALLAFAGCGSPASSDSSGGQPLPTPGVVIATAHPLVASYSVVAPNAGSVSVEFGTSTAYGRSTGSQTVSTGGGSIEILVTGMRPSTTYHLRARVALDDGTTLVDSDHTFTTGALPQTTFPAVMVTPSGLASSGGVDLVSGVGTNVSAAVFDTDGSIIWYYYDASLPSGTYAYPIRELDDGNFLVNFSTSDVREVDLEGRVVREITLAQLNAALAAAGYSLQAANIHHDLLRLDNGHWILLVNEYRDFQDLPGYPGTTSVLGDALVDLDTNNQPVWVWRAFDHLDVNRHPYMFPDWTHSNAIVYEPDGSLLLSMRHQSWILKIDYANGAGGGDVLWRLGPGGDFTLSVSDPAQWFYNQHYANLLQASGSTQQIALFDNGDTRPDSSGQPCTTDCYSRAVIMNIDQSALTAQISWQYSPGWYSSWGGSIVVLPNSDVEFDSTTVNGGYSKVLEVTKGATPQKVWEMDATDAAFYRAYRIPSLYPGVSW